MEYQRSLIWFLVPSSIVLATSLLYPLGYAFYLSFFNFYLPSNAMTFVGLENYIQLLTEERFWKSLASTLKIAFSAVALEFVVGLAIALGLYGLSEQRARVFSVLLFLPQIITPVVAALLLKWMFVGHFGLVEVVLTGLGLPSPDWLGSPGWAKVSIILADSWQYTPFMVLVLYAGLQGLDRNLLEAGSIDGASNLQLLWHVILPALRPIILFVLVIRMMDAFRAFDSIYVLTGGGPGTATETITFYTYTLAFRALEMGKAAALGVLTMLLITTIVLGTIAWLYRNEKGAF